jgi:hypothetical protein
LGIGSGSGFDVEEGGLDVILGRGDACLLTRLAARADDLLPLVVGEEVGHFSAVEDVVDVLDEGFDDDLSVGEEEDQRRAIAAGREVELLQVLAELVVAVALGEVRVRVRARVRVRVRGRGRARVRVRARARARVGLGLELGLGSPW